MTEAVLTRLRDFSCKTDTFEGCKPNGRPGTPTGARDPRGLSPGRPGEEVSAVGRAAGEGGPCSLDIESALAWLRWELMEMRSQDQVLIRQLMDLHAGIQELKQELSEEDQNDDDDDDEDGDNEDGDDEGEESSSWESCSETGSSSAYSGETECSASCLKMTTPPPLSTPAYWPSTSANRVSSRRSSVP